MLVARLLPVSCTFSALTTTIWSPQSMCGVYIALCLPLSRIAMTEASRPSTSPSASISVHFLSMSAGLAENVFMSLLPGELGSRRCRGVRYRPQPVKAKYPCKSRRFVVRYHITVSRRSAICAKLRRSKRNGDHHGIAGAPRGSGAASAFGARRQHPAADDEPAGGAKRAVDRADERADRGARRCRREP